MSTLTFPEMMRPGEVAPVWRLSSQTICRHCREGLIEGAVKVGRNSWLIPRATVEARLRGQPSEPTPAESIVAELCAQAATLSDEQRDLIRRTFAGSDADAQDATEPPSVVRDE